MESLTNVDTLTISMIIIIIVCLWLLWYIWYGIKNAPIIDEHEEFTLVVADIYGFKEGDAIEIANKDAPNGKSRCIIKAVDENKNMITLVEI